MKNSIFFFLSTFLLFFLCSCKSQKRSDQDIVINISDSFIRDLPKYPNGKVKNIYGFINRMVNKLDIDDIDGGYNQLQIRVWSIYDFFDTSQLFLLKRNNNKWEAEQITYYFKGDSSRSKYIDTIISKHIYKPPLSGWDSFTNELLQLGIKDLPDMDNIPGNTFDINHGDLFIVEVATTKTYRLYSYIDPENFKNKWKQAEEMEDILRLIEKEFDFKRLR